MDPHCETYFKGYKQGFWVGMLCMGIGGPLVAMLIRSLFHWSTKG
jgi:hypothetical protein